MLSYRTAVFGIIGGLLLLTAWLWAAGLPLWAAVILLGATFVLFLALKRAVCEVGIPVIRPAMSGSAFLISGFGSQAVGDEGLVQLATWMTYWMQSPSGPNWTGWMTTILGQFVCSGMWNILDQITADPAQMGGVPCIRGLRIPVSTIVGLLADGMTTEQILDAYPDLEREDVQEALRYAALLTQDREVELSQVR